MGRAWERLGPGDRNYLGLETADTPMHIAALARLESALSVESARARLELRTRGVRALRRRLHRPGPPFGPQLWIDDGAFAIERHVLEARIAAPGGEREVLRAAEDLVTRRLDRSCPLWAVWFLTGLEGGRAAVLLKLHHAVADGLAALGILGALFDQSEGAEDPGTAPPDPRPAPGRGELLVDSGARKLAACRRLAVAVSHPARVRDAPGTIRQEFAGARASPVRTSLNGPVGPGRRLAVVRLGLEQARSVAHAHGATVNDVILTLAAAGLRDVLRERGERVETLLASVAATVRPAGEAGALGNRVGALMVPLSVGDLAPADHLDAVTASTRRPNEPSSGRPQRGSWSGSRIRGRPAPGSATSTSSRCSRPTCPDRPPPCTCSGHRVLDLLPITALAGNIRFSFAALSYAGGLAITVCAAGAEGPDLEILRSGMERTWEALRADHGATAGGTPGDR